MMHFADALKDGTDYTPWSAYVRLFRVEILLGPDLEPGDTLWNYNTHLPYTVLNPKYYSRVEPKQQTFSLL